MMRKQCKFRVVDIGPAAKGGEWCRWNYRRYPMSQDRLLVII